MVDTDSVSTSDQSDFLFVTQVIRLEGQVTRYKSAAESAEKIEDELKVEKRKLQREVSLCSGPTLPVSSPPLFLLGCKLKFIFGLLQLRVALDRITELEASNGHLTKRLEKMKANRSALLAQQ